VLPAMGVTWPVSPLSGFISEQPATPCYQGHSFQPPPRWAAPPPIPYFFFLFFFFLFCFFFFFCFFFAFFYFFYILFVCIYASLSLLEHAQGSSQLRRRAIAACFCAWRPPAVLPPAPARHDRRLRSGRWRISGYLQRGLAADPAPCPPANGVLSCGPWGMWCTYCRALPR